MCIQSHAYDIVQVCVVMESQDVNPTSPPLDGQVSMLHGGQLAMLTH